MTDVVLQVMRYTRDLLTHDEALIHAGRTNFEIKDFDLNYIIVDYLTSPRQYIQQQYDGTNEVMKLTHNYTASMTIDFYGLDAFTTAHRWVALYSGPSSNALQLQYGIRILTPSTINNINFLTATTNQNRLQLSFNTRYNLTVDDPVLRIDTPIFTVITD